MKNTDTPAMPKSLNDFEALSQTAISKLSKDSDRAREYLCSFGEFMLYAKYISNQERFAGDFACHLATLIASYRREIIGLNDQVNQLKGEIT